MIVVTAATPGVALVILLDLGGDGASAIERGAFGQLRLHQQRALILLRQKPRRHGAAEAQNRGDRDADQRQGQQHPRREPPDDAGIAALHAVDAALHRADDPAGRRAVAQQQRAQGRRQGQRVQRRDQHRHRHGDGELLVELADDAGDESDRNKDRQQHQGDRDDRRGDLAHRRFGRVGRRHFGMLGDHVLDRLDDDDRVVDDDPDRQHQRQQRDRVGRKAERQHHRKGADQRHRHRDDRHQGRAQAAEKDKDDRPPPAQRLRAGS